MPITKLILEQGDCGKNPWNHSMDNFGNMYLTTGNPAIPFLVSIPRKQ